MAVKLLSPRIELLALMLMCSSGALAAQAYSTIRDESYFGTEWGKAAFRRLSLYMKRNTDTPSIAELISDPGLTKDHRERMEEGLEVIRDVNLETISKDTLRRLDEMRRSRIIHQMDEYIHETYHTNDKIEDLDGFLSKLSDMIHTARTKCDVEQQLYNIGVGCNVEPIVERILDDSPPRLVPTGFKQFDAKNGGIGYGSLLVIGGSTGGGKSILTNQLLMNMAESVDVVFVPLEMTEEETVARQLANLSGIPINRIIAKKITEKERAKMVAAYKEWHKGLKKKGNRFGIFRPVEDMSIEEVLMTLHPHDYKVIAIDYLGLLKGVDGDDAWQALGRAARYGKIYAATHDRIVALVAQVSEDGKIRYARSIAEHSNNAWIFVATDATKEQGIIDIRQVKARNQDPFPFTLSVDYATCRVWDEGGKTNNDQAKTTSNKSKRAKREVEEYLDDIDD